jgi:hypothetical protein
MNFRRMHKIIRNAPSLLMGYNIYVDTDKLKLIDEIFRVAQPVPRSFADLGGVWKVNGAYSLYTLRKKSIEQGVLIDTDFPPGLEEKLLIHSRLRLIKGDFANLNVFSRLGKVDVIFLFDVLLHQANPSWNTVLSAYGEVAQSIAIFNQQYVLGDNSVRLTSLSLKDYIAIAPRGREELYRYVYAHGDEIHPTYNKPWRDIHNIFQWGITDKDIRTQMKSLGFREVYFKNCGKFSNLPAFENHAFIFVRDSERV